MAFDRYKIGCRIQVRPPLREAKKHYSEGTFGVKYTSDAPSDFQRGNCHLRLPNDFAHLRPVSQPAPKSAAPH